MERRDRTARTLTGRSLVNKALISAGSILAAPLPRCPGIAHEAAMRVTNGKIGKVIGKVSPSRRSGSEHFRSGGSVAASSRDAVAAKLPAVSSAGASYKPDRGAKISRAAAFLTQLLAQCGARHSDARMARRFPEEPLRRYAQAAGLRKTARAALSSRMRPVTV